MRDDTVLDVEGIDEVLPRAVIEMEYRLMFLRAACLLLVSRPSFAWDCVVVTPVSAKQSLKRGREK